MFSYFSEDTEFSYGLKIFFLLFSPIIHHIPLILFFCWFWLIFCVWRFSSNVWLVFLGWQNTSKIWLEVGMLRQGLSTNGLYHRKIGQQDFLLGDSPRVSTCRSFLWNCSLSLKNPLLFCLGKNIWLYPSRNRAEEGNGKTSLLKIQTHFISYSLIFVHYCPVLYLYSQYLDTSSPNVLLMF